MSSCPLNRRIKTLTHLALRVVGDRQDPRPLGRQPLMNGEEPTDSPSFFGHCDAPFLAADAVAAGGGAVGEGGRRGAARRVAAAGGVAAPEDPGHRHRQPAGRGSRGTAGQRVCWLPGSPVLVAADNPVHHSCGRSGPTHRFGPFDVLTRPGDPGLQLPLPPSTRRDSVFQPGHEHERAGGWGRGEGGAKVSGDGGTEFGVGGAGGQGPPPPRRAKRAEGAAGRITRRGSAPWR